MIPLAQRALRYAMRGLIAFMVLWLVASVVAEREMLHPYHRGVGPAPSHWGLAYRDVSFATTDGLTLRGWWIPGRLHQDVVMVHGWTSSRAEPMSKALYLHQAGYNILVFDLRGHGQSDGNYTTMGVREPQDVMSAVTEALRLDRGPVALVGYSMGAATAVEAAALDPQVVAVVEDSGYSTLTDAFLSDVTNNWHMPAWLAAPLVAYGQVDLGFSLDQVRPIDFARRLDKPLLAIVPTADRTVPPRDGYALYGAAPGPKQLFTVAGAGHVAGYWLDQAQYERTVLGFLAASMRIPASAMHQPPPPGTLT